METKFGLMKWFSLFTVIILLGGYTIVFGNEKKPLTEPVILNTVQGNIYGTLQLPEKSGRAPVALIIAGSGPTDRDGNSPLIQGVNNNLKMISLELANAGIASLRYDKRGIAASKAAMKSESDLRFDDYINDAVAWVDYLRKDVQFSRICQGTFPSQTRC